MKMDKTKTIGFLGVGNMGGAILGGYAAACAGKEMPVLLAYRRDTEKLQVFCQKHGAEPADSIVELVQKSDVLVMGIKPYQFDAVMPEVTASFTKDKILVSMAAGITIRCLEGYVGSDAKIVRIMPNTPAMVGEAMTAVCRNGNVSDGEFQPLMEIFRSIGKAEEVDEDLIHCVIGLSGSSPAYTYMYIEALMRAAVRHGMTEEKARVFAAQAVLGAARMVLEGEESPEQLRINVCSPNGTTLKAVEVLMEKDFESVVEDAFDAAVARSKEMSGE